MLQAEVRDEIPTDIMERLVLMSLASREPISVLEIEDLVPQSMYTPSEVEERIRQLESQGWIRKIPALTESNGTTLYVLSNVGRDKGRLVLQDEIRKGFPTAQHVFAAALFQAFPAIKEKLSIKEVFDVVQSRPDQFLSVLEENIRVG